MDERVRASRIEIIVLNWNNAQDTLACLESLERLTYPNHEIIVVDNGSTDESVPRIRAAYPGVQLLETGANLGYAGGNNVGIRYALQQGADYVCILNNDVLVAPGLLEPLVAVAAGAGDRCAVTSPAVCEMGHPEVIWSLGAGIVWRNGTVVRLHSGEKYETWLTKPSFEVDYVPGSAMLVPREAWEAVGLIDEAYFLYYEEADWCVQARLAGFKILAVPNAVIWHEVEAQGNRTSPEVTYYMTRNALRFLHRNLSRSAAMAPMFRSVLLAHWHVLGDVRHGEFRRAWFRVRGVYDYLLNRLGPLK